MKPPPCHPNQTLDYNIAELERLDGDERFGRIAMTLVDVDGGTLLIAISERQPSALIGTFTPEGCFVQVVSVPADAAARQFFGADTRALLFPATLEL